MSTTKLALILGVFGVLGRFSSAEPGRVQLVTELYDVRSIESAMQPTPGGRIELPLIQALSFTWNVESANDREFALAGDDWGPLLARAFSGVANSELAVTYQGGLLWIRTEAAVHAEIETFLAHLESHLLRTVVIELYDLPLDMLGRIGNAVLSRAQTDQLLGSIPPSHPATLVTRLADEVNMFAGRRQATLIDYDVEVAQFMATSDPIVVPVQDGLELQVEVRTAADGRHFVSLGGVDSQALEARSVDSSSQFGPIEVPRVRSALHGASALLEDGGAMIVGDNQVGLWMLRVERNNWGLAENGGRDLRFVAAGDLITAPLLHPVRDLRGPEPSGGFDDEKRESWSTLVDHFSEPLVTLSQLREQFLLPLLSMDGAMNASIELIDGDLFLSGPDQLISEVTSLLRNLAMRFSTNVVVDLRIGILDSSDAPLASVGLVAPAELASKLTTRAIGVCRAGDSLLLISGTEIAYVQDSDVEIAQSAAIGDPVMESLFEGHSFWIRPTVLADGRINALVDLQYQDASDAFDVAEAGREELNILELPESEVVSLRTQVTLQDGEWSLLTVSPLTDDASLAVVIRARGGDTP